MSNPNIMIAGAGRLGLRVGLLMREFEKRLPLNVICVNSSERLRHLVERLGFSLLVSGETLPYADKLLISLPPRGDYLNEVKKYLGSWKRRGPAVLISSTGVYSASNQEQCDEDSPTQSDSLQRQAEMIALDAGANVVRLAGLYDSRSGPHTFWQNQTTLSASPTGLINLIHRQDAARAVSLLLNSNNTKAILWNVCDGAPLTRKQICESWAQHMKTPIPSFAPHSNNLDEGRRIINYKFCETFDWQPEYKNFYEFLKKRSAKI